MNVIEGIYARRTTRAFLRDRDIPEEVIRELVEIAGRAPSWASAQPWEVYVATGKKMDEIRDAYAYELTNNFSGKFEFSDIPGPGFDDWEDTPLCVENMAIWKKNRLDVMGVTNEEYGNIMGGLTMCQLNAPVCVFLCLNKSLTPYSFYDLGAFGQTLMLAATEKGIDSAATYLSVLFGDVLHKSLGIPDNTNVVLGISLGYADKEHIINKPDAKQMAVDQYLKIVSE